MFQEARNHHNSDIALFVQARCHEPALGIQDGMTGEAFRYRQAATRRHTLRQHEFGENK